MSVSNSLQFQDFSPKGYLNEYYSEVEAENAALLSFFVDCYKEVPINSLDVLEIGGGPTVYQLISLAPVAKSICFSDYLEENLQEVKAWVYDQKDAFDWDIFIQSSLQIENSMKHLSDSDIEARAKEIRAKLNNFITCDIFTDDVVNSDTKFDLISTNFVAESVCTTKQEVGECLKRFVKLLKPQGCLVITGLLGAEEWHVGDKKFPAASLNAGDAKELIKINNLEIEIFKTIPSQYAKDDPRFQGYEGMFMVKAMLKV